MQNQIHNLLTWRIIPFSKWLVTPIYKPFRPFGMGITLLRGLTIHGDWPFANWDDPPSNFLQYKTWNTSTWPPQVWWCFFMLADISRLPRTSQWWIPPREWQSKVLHPKAPALPWQQKTHDGRRCRNPISPGERLFFFRGWVFYGTRKRKLTWRLLEINLVQ